VSDAVDKCVRPPFSLDHWRSLLLMRDVPASPPKNRTARRSQWRAGAGGNARSRLRVPRGKRGCSWTVPISSRLQQACTRPLAARSVHPGGGQCEEDLTGWWGCAFWLPWARGCAAGSGTLDPATVSCPLEQTSYEFCCITTCLV